MFKLKRNELLQKLQAVQPGTATKEDTRIEQSNCFIFRNGFVQTFNDDIACSMESGLPESFSAAVPVTKFLQILSKMPEDEIDLEWSDSEITIHGRKGRKSGFRLESEILSAVDSVEQPTEWKKLPEHFAEAVSIVQECAGDEKLFVTNVVHVHPNWLEAGDDVQCVRYKMKTGIETATMIRQKAIKHVVSLGMTEFAEAESWIHFRNPMGLTYSCRCFIDPPYPTEDVDGALENMEGTPMSMPKGLVDSVDLAETIIAGEKKGVVMISLRPGRLKLRAYASDGTWIEEPRKIVYDGQSIRFMIAPKLLKELVNKHNEVLISEDKIKVNGGRWLYVTCLGIPEAKKNTEELAEAIDE